MIKPRVNVSCITDTSVTVQQNITALGRMAVYVGIPQATATRQMETAALIKGSLRTKRNRRLLAALDSKIENAQLLFIHTKGSMRRRIPPRPVVEPAILANFDRRIEPELRDAAVARLAGNVIKATAGLKRAGMAGQSAAKIWFTDPRNGWAPNAPSTIRRKGSSRPLIDTAQMRNSLTYVLAEDTTK